MSWPEVILLIAVMAFVLGILFLTRHRVGYWWWDYEAAWPHLWKTTEPLPTACCRCHKNIDGTQVYLAGYGLICPDCDAELARLDGYADRNRN